MLAELRIEEEAVAADEHGHAEDRVLGGSATERCCRCTRGAVGWSATGQCSFCQGNVEKTASVTSECKKGSTNFPGKTACADFCTRRVGALLQAELSTEDETIAKGDQGHAEHGQWPSIFGSSTTEQCCRCKSGTVGWSATGRCSFCKGDVSQKLSVPAECKQDSKNFAGNTACANSCKTSIGALLQVEDGAEDEAVVVAADHYVEVGEWPSIFGSSTTEQCCRCRNGTVGWSATGKCSFCNGSVAKKLGVTAVCTKSSNDFAGNAACAKWCKASVGALLQAEVSVEEEALATEEAGQAGTVQWPSIFGSSTAEAQVSVPPADGLR